MAGLNINPIPALVQKIDAGIKQAIAQVTGGPSIGHAQDKARLDAKVNREGGGLGSGVNQASGVGQTFNDQINTGMGNVIDTTVQSPLGSGSISSLTDGGTFGAIGDFARGVGSDISGALEKVTGGDLAGGIKDIASLISKTAGAANDVLSLKRAENLPKDGELFVTGGEGLYVLPREGDDWRVRIGCDWSLFKNNPVFQRLGEDGTNGVVFPILPTISYSTKANYTSIDPIHNNYPFQAYKNSQVDDIQIDGTFICESQEQAAYWISAVTFFKTVTKMFFGQGANAGAPPPVCNLNGYGASIFNNVPVVVKSFSVELPNDVNYIRCDTYGTRTWVPITSSINVTVTPVYNRRNLRQFNLEDYAKGTLVTPGKTGRGYL